MSNEPTCSQAVPRYLPLLKSFTTAGIAYRDSRRKLLRPLPQESSNQALCGKIAIVSHGDLSE